MVRELRSGMGQAVGERTVLRYFLAPDELSDPDIVDSTNTVHINPGEEHRAYVKWNAAALNSDLNVKITPEAPIRGRMPMVRYETWGDVADRVAFGNASLLGTEEEQEFEYTGLYRAISKATVLMSGRHLQHGDETQRHRPMEVFTNCATSATSFALFYLLLNGAGVGRSYDDALCVANWDNAPTLRVVLDSSHPDFDMSAHESTRDAAHKYGTGKDIMWFKVPDTREGWAKAIEIFENAAYEKIHANKMLILDFSDVREAGSPIKGMQNRPSSGPVPLMNALMKVASLKGANLPKWLQAMFVDHYLAECVLVGGARRAARMSTKFWKDSSIFDFMAIKRPVEYHGSKVEDIIDYREQLDFPPLSFLWSSNNSVVVDDEFWGLLALKRGAEGYDSKWARHARKVFNTGVDFAYGDGTGEPGFINGHKLVSNDDGMDKVDYENFFGSDRYKPEEDTLLYLRKLVRVAKNMAYHYITNPCGEIVLHVLGAFCVIADIVPYHAETLSEAREAFRIATRALMRVNTMGSVYQAEVQRTNRIGVGMTGVHEFAWKFFRVAFRDMLDPDIEAARKVEVADNYDVDDLPIDPRVRAGMFWLTLNSFNKEVKDEAARYAKILGVVVPHTALTIKPAGTTSKLFGLTEGWHLPSMAWFIRWVQFRSDDPLVEDYATQGYPVIRDLQTYEGTTIVGFPTVPVLTELGLGDELVTAAEATMEEQFRWIELGEQYYIRGDHGPDMGNQISYTLKYKDIPLKDFKKTIMEWQPRVRCCSVMPTESKTGYEYLPEEPVSKARFQQVQSRLQRNIAVSEEVGMEHVDCGSGACPIDFKEE